MAQSPPDPEEEGLQIEVMNDAELRLGGLLCKVFFKIIKASFVESIH